MNNSKNLNSILNSKPNLKQSYNIEHNEHILGTSIIIIHLIDKLKELDLLDHYKKYKELYINKMYNNNKSITKEQYAYENKLNIELGNLITSIPLNIETLDSLYETLNNYSMTKQKVLIYTAYNIYTY